MAKGQTTMNGRTMLQILDTLYDKTLSGVPGVSVPVEQMAQEYADSNPVVEHGVRAMLNRQVAKCTASGVITGIGGFATLPLSIPANVSSILYMQMRMIACAAYMAGRDLSNVGTQALVYACLAGISGGELEARASVTSSQKLKIKAASRLAKKLGEKGVLNLVKLIPVVGAGVNGGVDFLQSRTVADRAYRMFFEGGYAYEDEPSLKDKGMKMYEDVKQLVLRKNR